MSHFNDNEQGGSETPTESRFSQRRMSFKKCQIILAHHAGVFDVILRNLSRTGALIDVDHVLHVPKQFQLRLVTDDIVRDCELVWRSGGRIGVVFTQ